MSRTICPFKYVTPWILCTAGFGLLPHCFGQGTLPPLLPVNVPNFTIPFEIEESANSIREVELFVSKDRGKRWTSVARQPVESKKFVFRADSDDEYWFTFRTATTTENAAPISGPPQLRVLVKTTREPTVILPSQPSESGPLIPPKPERYRGERIPKPQPKPQESADTSGAETEKPESEVLESEVPETGETETASEQEDAESTSRILAPILPGFEPLEPRGRNLLDDLLSGMRPFMDVQPVEVSREFPNNSAVPAVPKSPPTNPANPPSELPAGSIARIDMNTTSARPQIVVKWNPGHELWKDAQVDVFRSSTKEGPWTPIAINLSNSGEYWWFLTPEDMKPFYVAVRIRSYIGGTLMDVTHSPVAIDPKLSLSQDFWTGSTRTQER